MENRVDQPCIQVWPFHDAPEDLRRLSDNGGDEDWLAYVPAKYKDTYIGWLEYGNFGCCDISKYELGDGSYVAIGSHA